MGEINCVQVTDYEKPIKLHISCAGEGGGVTFLPVNRVSAFKADTGHYLMPITLSSVGAFLRLIALKKKR